MSFLKEFFESNELFVPLFCSTKFTELSIYNEICFLSRAASKIKKEIVCECLFQYYFLQRCVLVGSYRKHLFYGINFCPVWYF